MSAKRVVRGVVIAVAVLLASSASALDFHGYFRDSAAFNSEGGTQACFGLPGSDFKARLGNECDRYLEFTFGEGGKYENIDWRLEFMPASYVPETGTGSEFFVQQMWLGLRSKEWGGAQVWAGRRYWKRHDVHSLDWFYWNPAQGNAAVGVEDVNLGFGKLAVSVFRMDASAGDLQLGTYAVPEVRVYGIRTNRNGTLEVGVDLGIAHDQNEELGAGRAGASPLFTVQHNQDKILGGSNTLVFQYGQGAFANESGGGPGQLLAGGTSDDKQWRIIEHLVVNPTREISGALVLVYQDKSAAGSTGARIFTGELRPSYHFNDWFKLTLDAFYQTVSIKNAPAGTGSPSLVKITAAPTLVLGRGYYTRPELRLFVTFADWNDAAAALGPIGGGAFGTDTSGASFGAQVEMWF
jgi:maltoporin